MKPRSRIALREPVKDRLALLLVALLVSGGALFSPSSSQTNSPMQLEGTWIGTLEVQNVEYPFAVTFERVDGEFRGDMDIIASLSPDIEVDDISEIVGAGVFGKSRAHDSRTNPPRATGHQNLLCVHAPCPSSVGCRLIMRRAR